jgi:hypothetical protein
MRNQNDRRAALRAAILLGRADIAEGRSKPFDADLIRDIAHRGKVKSARRSAERSEDVPDADNQ